MSKEKFVAVVEKMFLENGVVDQDVIAYFSTLKRTKAKASSGANAERAEAIKDGILEALDFYGRPIDRSEVKTYFDSNNKLTDVTVQSISSYASQLVAEGKIKKGTERFRKRSRTVYSEV